MIILVEFENTPTIINYLLVNNFLYKNLYFQTIYLLDALNAKLGFSRSQQTYGINQLTDFYSLLYFWNNKKNYFKLEIQKILEN